MSKQIIKGDELQLFLQDGAPKYATSHTLTLSGATLDTNTKDHGFFGASEVGKLTWELTAECLYTDGDYDKMFDMMIAHTPFLLTFAKVKNYSQNGLISVGGDVDMWLPDVIQRKGYAVVTSLTANANTGENATYSITFTGTGPLRTVDNSITDYYIDVTYRNLATGTVLFNKRGSYGVNSIWVSDENMTRPIQLDLSSNTYDLDTVPQDAFIRFYLSSYIVPENLFRGSNTINSVSLSDTTSRIGQYAFCDSTIRILETDSHTLLNIYAGAFAGCTNLVNINRTNDKNTLLLHSLGANAFSGCVALTEMLMLGDIVTIPTGCFANCMALREVQFPESVMHIGEDAFTLQLETPIEYVFNSENAPDLIGTLPLRRVSQISQITLNNSSKEDWLSESTWAQYEDVRFID